VPTGTTEQKTLLIVEPICFLTRQIKNECHSGPTLLEMDESVHSPPTPLKLSLLEIGYRGVFRAFVIQRVHDSGRSKPGIRWFDWITKTRKHESRLTS
jgi:hypothetical protein